MDSASTPEPFKEAFSESLVTLEKLRNVANISSNQNADFQNILNSVQFQTSVILEKIIAILPSLQIATGQNAEIQTQRESLERSWNDHLGLSRKVMLFVDNSNKKESLVELRYISG